MSIAFSSSMAAVWSKKAAIRSCSPAAACTVRSTTPSSRSRKRFGSVSEQLFIVRAVGRTVFVGVAQRASISMPRLMQIDDIVSADMTREILKGKSLPVPRVWASRQVPQHLRGGPFAFREDIDIGNRVGTELIPFSRRRNVLHECLVDTRPFETLQELRDLVIGRIGRDQDRSSIEFRQDGGGAGSD